MAEDDAPPSKGTGEGSLQNCVVNGFVTGLFGIAGGAIRGVLQNVNPVISATASGVQWFGLGTTYFVTRRQVLQGWCQDPALATPREKLLAGTISGGVSGAAMSLLLRGRRNIIPGGVTFALFGAMVQGAQNFSDRRREAKTEAGTENHTTMEWLAKQKWSPISVLTDDQYKDILRERILKMDVEIALLDERMQDLKQKAEAHSNDQES